MNDKISFEIETLSNLFIGGAPGSFEIGGIDQYTVTDEEDYPYIPASSLKGTLATIVREDDSDMAREISKLYGAYIEKLKTDNWDQIVKLATEEAKKRIEKRYDDALANERKAEYLFGIKGFNNTPKLLFSDFLLKEECKKRENCFSIDMKNSINSEGQKPVSNPRSYKTARSGLVFEGSIKLHKIGDLGEGAEELCIEFVKDNLVKFNEGIYRLGNSKSRGYGKIEVDFPEN